MAKKWKCEICDMPLDGTEDKCPRCRVELKPVARVQELEAAALAAVPEPPSPVTVALLKALKKAYHELNEIRARDGVPWCADGYRSSVDAEYFSSVVDECREALALAASAPVSPVLKQGIREEMARMVADAAAAPFKNADVQAGYMEACRVLTEFIAPLSPEAPK